MASLAIIIPTYNPSQTLLNVISECTKRFKDTQIIIVDDGSTEGLEILDEIQGKYKQNISIINLKRNLGKIEAIKTALKNVNAEYILLLDDDTIIDTDKEKILKLTRENPEVDLFLFKVRAYNPKNFIEKIQDIEYTISTYSIKKIIGLPMGSIGPGALWKRELLENVLKLHDGTFAGDDLQMYLHTIISLEKHDKVKHVPEVTLYTEPKHNFLDYVSQRVKIWIPGLMHNLRMFLPKIILSRHRGELVIAYKWIFLIKLYFILAKLSLVIFYKEYYIIDILAKLSLIILIYLIIISINNLINIYKLLFLIGSGILGLMIALTFSQKIALFFTLIYVFSIFYFLIIYNNNIYNKYKYIYNINIVLIFFLFSFFYNVIIETIGILYYVLGRYK